MNYFAVDRRELIVGVAALSVMLARASFAADRPVITVNKDPNCGCCGAWVGHLRQAGFVVEVTETTELNRIKARLGVPSALASCHTAEVDGYLIEGHVPAKAINRLLTERPEGQGLAVPGMPVGSPGMEVEGSQPEVYSVILFSRIGQRTFGKYRGADEI